MLFFIIFFFIIAFIRVSDSFFSFCSPKASLFGAHTALYSPSNVDLPGPPSPEEVCLWTQIWTKSCDAEPETLPQPRLSSTRLVGKKKRRRREARNRQKGLETSETLRPAESLGVAPAFSAPRVSVYDITALCKLNGTHPNRRNTRPLFSVCEKFRCLSPPGEKEKNRKEPLVSLAKAGQA